MLLRNFDGNDSRKSLTALRTRTTPARSGEEAINKTMTLVTSNIVVSLKKKTTEFRHKLCNCCNQLNRALSIFFVFLVSGNTRYKEETEKNQKNNNKRGNKSGRAQPNPVKRSHRSCGHRVRPVLRPLRPPPLP